MVLEGGMLSPREGVGPLPFFNGLLVNAITPNMALFKVGIIA